VHLSDSMTFKHRPDGGSIAQILSAKTSWIPGTGLAYTTSGFQPSEVEELYATDVAPAMGLSAVQPDAGSAPRAVVRDFFIRCRWFSDLAFDSLRDVNAEQLEGTIPEESPQLLVAGGPRGQRAVPSATAGANRAQVGAVWAEPERGGLHPFSMAVAITEQETAARAAARLARRVPDEAPPRRSRPNLEVQANSCEAPCPYD
jgi:hypothetical protein